VHSLTLRSTTSTSSIQRKRDLPRRSAGAHLKSSMLRSPIWPAWLATLPAPACAPPLWPAGAAPLALGAAGAPAAMRARPGSAAALTCATCRRMRKRSNSASSSSLSGSSLDAPIYTRAG